MLMVKMDINSTLNINMWIYIYFFILSSILCPGSSFSPQATTHRSRPFMRTRGLCCPLVVKRWLPAVQPTPGGWPSTTACTLRWRSGGCFHLHSWLHRHRWLWFFLKISVYVSVHEQITHPAGCMSQFIRFFGEQIMVLWKLALLRRRILIFSPPPVGVVCYRGEKFII